MKSSSAAASDAPVGKKPVRAYSLSYLTAHRCTPIEAIQIAAAEGYAYVGMRLWPNTPDKAVQPMLGEPAILKNTLAALRDTGVGVFDLEIIRINESFDPHTWDALYEIGAALKAKTILIAGDDKNEARLTENYARLCEALKPYGISADLEFMPWTAVPNANAALRIIRNAGMPANAGVIVDALHFARSHTTLDDIRAIPPALIHYAQICDAQAGTHFTPEQMIHTARCERLQPGEGNIELESLFNALPVDLPISIEIVNLEREKHFDPRQWAAQGLKSSRPYLER
ncbi:sugar phosphate isomerase/epimerase [Alcaligenaceae bacterium CGII-47]|nr:sugar phosphate isomerase/epimerase [Alcaligenaceae bacterium CGII-47]